jgi:uncharacterized phage-associated protein
VQHIQELTSLKPLKVANFVIQHAKHVPSQLTPTKVRKWNA